MAAESSTYIVPSPTAIVDGKFCTPFEVDLIIVRKLASLLEGNTLATDIKGNIIFRVRDTSTSSQHTRHRMWPATLSCHCIKRYLPLRRWHVFKEDASDHHHLLFSVRKSSVMPTSKANIDVYRAANTQERTSYYKIKGSWLDKSCTIYSGQGNTPIAQMRKEPLRTHTVITGKDIFTVIVGPIVDYAFVVALT